MEFMGVESLFRISLVKAAVIACNDFKTCLPVMSNDKIQHARLVHDHWSDNFCENCTQTLDERISCFPLPLELQKEMKGFCRHVYKEMMTWECGLLELHEEVLPCVFRSGCSCFDRLHLIRSFQWEPNGLIKGKTTARKLLQNPLFNIKFRFVLGCYFGLESELNSLWATMPEITKLDFRSGTCSSLPVVSYWLKFLNLSVTPSVIVSAIRSISRTEGKYHLLISQVELLRYFLELPIDLPIFCSDFVLDSPKLIRFFLLDTEEEQQEPILKENPWAVLNSFLDWPYQRHFMEFANRMWNFLQVGDYSLLMDCLYKKIKARWDDFDYITLLTEFWDNSPTYLKQHVRNECRYIYKPLIECLETDYGFYDFH